MPALNWTRNRTNQRRADARRADNDAAAYTSDLRAAETPPPPTRANLTKPIVVSRFWRNQAREVVVTTLEEFKGAPVINVRIWYTGRDGVLRPGKQGICLSVRCLPALTAATTKALALAVELGLIPEGLACE